MPCLCGEDRDLSFLRRRESIVALVDSRLRGNDRSNGYYLCIKTKERQYERPSYC